MMHTVDRIQQMSMRDTTLQRSVQIGSLQILRCTISDAISVSGSEDLQGFGRRLISMSRLENCTRPTEQFPTHIVTQIRVT